MSTRLKCLLLDDELQGLSYLKLLCEELDEIEILRSFDDPMDFLANYRQYQADFCILDIEMPVMNGIELAPLLGDLPVIFITAYSTYAAQAYDIDAIDYIRKPVEIKRLKQAITKVNSYLSGTEKKQLNLIWNTDQGKSVIPQEEISYISTSETDARDKILWLKNGKKMVLKNISLRTVLEQLSPLGFCQINKQEIVALDGVMHFSKDQLILSFRDNSEMRISLSLSEKFRTDFLTKLKI